MASAAGLWIRERIPLSGDQLRELTGDQKPALQRCWLAENGYSFDVRRDGRPVVSRLYFEGRQGTVKARRLSVPDLAALVKLL